MHAMSNEELRKMSLVTIFQCLSRAVSRTGNQWLAVCSGKHITALCILMACNHRCMISHIGFDEVLVHITPAAIYDTAAVPGRVPVSRIMSYFSITGSGYLVDRAV